MVDIALRLIDLRPDARLEAVSRTGLLPQPHRWPGQRHPLANAHLPAPGTPLRELRAAFDEASAASYAQGGDWRDAINAVRLYTQDIWKGLSLDEQRRFLRTYRRYWDIHRHRMAPAVAAWIASLQEDGQLRTGAGRIERVAEAGGRLRVAIRRRDGTLDEREFAAAVNCTGPAGSVVGAGSPLYDSLLSAGLARPHPLDLGLDTAEAGALYDESGKRLDEPLYARLAAPWRALGIGRDPRDPRTGRRYRLQAHRSPTFASLDAGSIRRA